MDGALFEFCGNSWGIPQNAVDIALHSGKATGAPCDPVSALESSKQQRKHKRPTIIDEAAQLPPLNIV